MLGRLSQIVTEPFEERIPDLAFRRLRPVLDSTSNSGSTQNARWEIFFEQGCVFRISGVR